MPKAIIAALNDGLFEVAMCHHVGVTRTNPDRHAGTDGLLFTVDSRTREA
jgi:hypothetical protein